MSSLASTWLGHRAVGPTQSLNPVDRAILCVDSAARELGYPGLETQMLVWLDGRIAPSLLRSAIARLAHHYPIVTARLVAESGDGDNVPYWHFRPGEVCPVQEAFLGSDSPDAVLEYAGQILSNAGNPTEADPIAFHLIHRPGGKDVLLLQYNHVLMDNRIAIPLLRQLDSLSKTDGSTTSPSEHRNPILGHLRQFSRNERHAGIRGAIRLQAHTLRGKVATLVTPGPPPAGPARLRIITRSLGVPETAALRAQTVALSGFPCLSMAVLASAFRSIHHFGPLTDEQRDFVAAIGIPIQRGDKSLVFQNLTSIVPIALPHQDVFDRDRAVRVLCDRLRHQLWTGVDMGVLGTIAIFSRRMRYIEWAVRHLVRYGYSLWFAFFGALDAVGATFCGRRIESVYHTGGPIWSSIGVTLLVNQFQGQLYFQVTFDPRVVSESRANQFLDFVLADVLFRPAMPVYPLATYEIGNPLGDVK